MSPAIPEARVVTSNIAGSVSLACWIVLLLPQLIEQWRCRSSDGLNLTFLVIWALGDLFNLAGALWAGLLPEVILLACWYCMADVMVFTSYFYYRNMSKKDAQEAVQDDPTEPLLNRRNSAHRRKYSDETRRRDSLTEAVQADKGSVWTQFVLPVLVVFAAGVFGYFITGEGGEDPSDSQDDMDVGPQLLGYGCAALYLGARIPQIYQNHKRKSTQGLSLLFFILSTLGNVTYGVSILAYRYDKAWVMLNFSWLLGSLGTIVEDAIIFLQFYIYKNSQPTESAVEE